MPQHADTPGRIPSREGVRHGACIKVISVGGGGNNAINRMIDLGLGGVEFISVNTDLQSLQSSKAHVRLQLGAQLTHGLGAGADPGIGRRAALEESEKIVEVLKGADMVFITAGLGGGTGTGVAPVVASAASRMGALTVAIVTLPFSFEGKRRMKQAQRGLQDLLDHVDTLIVVPNDRILASAKDMGFFESFQIADDVLRQAVQGISDIITVPGVINRDFADVRTTMAGMGYGVMGTASRSGPHRASDAALAVIASPLLVAGAIEGARGILINIAGSNSLKLSEVHEASTIIQRAAHEDANIIFGAVLDERLEGEIKITVIATGFHQESRDRAERLTAERLSAMRSGVESPAVNFTRQPQLPPDAEIQADGLTTRDAEQARPEPPMPEIAANGAREVGQLQQTAQSAAPENLEHQEPGHISPEIHHDHELSSSLGDTGHNPLAVSESNAAAVTTEEDLLAYIEGPPFDLESIVNGADSAPEAEILIQPEIVRLRQAAMAAYAANLTREIEDERPIPPEDASFAEILESRLQMHGIEEDRSDYIPDEEAVPRQKPVPSDGGLSQPGLAHKTDKDSEPVISRSQESPLDGPLEPPADSDFTGPPFIDSTAAPYPAGASSSADTPTARPVRTKQPTPDFNRRLNREPDFSTGVEVI